MSNEPTVSVIIPTYNRSASVQRTLDALCAQTYPVHEIEVIVVADGCTDGTVEALRHYEAPFSLCVLEQSNQGPSVARNRGAAQARGRLLVFLDDDIESAPSLIDAHVRAHAGQPERVVIGYLPPVVQMPTDAFQIQLRNWWEAMVRPMRQPGYRYGYWNLLSGNFSLSADLFARVGGFDTTLRCHEDYELGMRLLNAGASFTFAVDAMGYHHDFTSLDRAFRRKRQEGRADVMIGRCHPKLRPSMQMARFRKPWSFLSRALRTLAFTWPAGGDLVAAGLQRTLYLYEWSRLRRRWHKLLNELLVYWYWRGVAEELGSWRALSAFLQGGPPRADEGGHEIEIDLRAGLDAAERRLDEERPDGVRVCYGGQPVGHIRPHPGSERLRGAHLRPFLATELTWPLLLALTMARATGSGTEPGWLPAVPDARDLDVTLSPQESGHEAPVFETSPEGDRLWP